MSLDLCWRPPDDQALPAAPPFRSPEGARSANAYAAALEQFLVETSPRYQPGILNGEPSRLAPSWCNLFCVDVTEAMGCGLPRKDKKGKYLTANELYDWLVFHGVSERWVLTEPARALQLVETGCPVVAAAPKREGHGHMAMVRPQGVIPSGYGRMGELRVAQAGARNSVNIALAAAFGKLLPSVKLFAHA
jgi:hypothetical protein